MSQKARSLSEGEIDELVAAHADDDSAWSKPTRVRRSKSEATLFAGELAARAALLARFHTETSILDFLRQADDFFKNGNYAPAAIVVGSILEDCLRKLCYRENLSISTRASISSLNTTLARAGVYNASVKKKIAGLVTIRNKAAQGKWDQFEGSDIEEMINQMKNLIDDVFIREFDVQNVGPDRPTRFPFTNDPKILGGATVFRGTRVPVTALLDNIEAGLNLDEFLDNFPTVTRDQAIQVLEIAKETLARSGRAA